MVQAPGGGELCVQTELCGPTEPGSESRKLCVATVPGLESCELWGRSCRLVEVDLDDCSDASLGAIGTRASSANILPCLWSTGNPELGAVLRDVSDVAPLLPESLFIAKDEVL